MLDLFGTNLNKLALDDKLDPVVGREDEILRMIQILGRRRKNNPILVGEPGVGKTSIVEGLVNKIIKNFEGFEVGDILESYILEQVVI